MRVREFRRGSRSGIGRVGRAIGRRVGRGLGIEGVGRVRVRVD